MCLILFAWQARRRTPLLIAANRDEFYSRPTAPAAFWADAPGILAGRDLQGGGTWLGITRRGRFAAVTNYRDPASVRASAPSRGGLVRDYLRGRRSPLSYLNSIAPGAGRYNGFSLLVGDPPALWYFSNRGGLIRPEPGIHGISNHLLDTPWPKVEKGKRALAELLKKGGEPSAEELFALLGDHDPAPDDALLPDTGIGRERERALSPLFVQTEGYGTRSSTVLMIGSGGEVTFVERVFQEGVPWMTAQFQFQIEAPRRRKG